MNVGNKSDLNNMNYKKGGYIVNGLLCSIILKDK
jgi:hypothetical protein